MPVEPRPAPPEVPVAEVAVQTTPQPTNKVAAATNTAGALGAVITGALSQYGDAAIRELWAALLPNVNTPATLNLLSTVIIATGSFFLIRWISRLAAYNVLDAPNVPMQPVPSPTAEAIR